MSKIPTIPIISLLMGLIARIFPKKSENPENTRVNKIPADRKMTRFFNTFLDIFIYVEKDGSENKKHSPLILFVCGREKNELSQ